MIDATPAFESISQPGDELLPIVYEELRQMASARMAKEVAGQTLQATALVHEAWLRLAGSSGQLWQSRAHFFGAASQAMRRILIESARRKARLKRGGNPVRVDIDGLDLATATPHENLLLINEALGELEKEHPERGRVVTMKFFGGLTNQEIAETLRISERSVNRHWLCARAWLYLRLKDGR